MLLGVVLVGRALEERAKLRATADMAALQVGWWGRGVGGEGQRHSLLLFNADWFLTLFSEGSPFPIPTLLPPLKSTRPPPPPPPNPPPPPPPPVQGLLPPMARLLLGDGSSWREVPSESVALGDLLAVLPGDRVPVDGVSWGSARGGGGWQEAGGGGLAAGAASRPAGCITSGEMPPPSAQRPPTPHRHPTLPRCRRWWAGAAPWTSRH